MAGKRVVVTGGSGFLGSFIVDRLQDSDWCGKVLIPRKENFDLRTAKAVKQMYKKMRPDIVIHLAAVVGGIGANRANPASFFYDNLMMGIHTMHYAHQFGVEKFVSIGTVCAYPKFTPVPFHDHWPLRF